MRWKKDPLLKHKGKERIVRKFLWFPTRIDNDCRWWEHAYIMQRVMPVDVGGSMEWGRYKHYWINIRWADEDAEGR
jgi:hypothetical protein